MSFLLSVISICSLATATLFLLHSDVQAEFYKYKDASGAFVITNKFEDIPKKYRKSVKVVWDEELAAKDPLAKRVAIAEARREQQQRKQPQQQKKQGGTEKLQPSDGKTLVITFDEETGQIIRRME